MKIEFEQALPIFDLMRPMSPTLFLETQLYLKMHAHDQNAIDSAIQACDACGIPLLGVAVAYGIHAYYYDCSPTKLRNCLARLDSARRSAGPNVHFWQTFLRCLIALGEERKAAELYQTLPLGIANGAALGPFRMFFDVTQGHHDKARRDWTRHIRATHHICVNAPSSYPRTVHLNYTERAGALLLFVTIFNAIDYLDGFFDHYRSLGVDHFFVIDNGSSDRSLDRLSANADVSVF